MEDQTKAQEIRSPENNNNTNSVRLSQDDPLINNDEANILNQGCDSMQYHEYDDQDGDKTISFLKEKSDFLLSPSTVQKKGGSVCQVTSQSIANHNQPEASVFNPNLLAQSNSNENSVQVIDNGS